MKTQKRKVVSEKEVTEYLAEDGTAFDNMNDCREYEKELINKQLDESPDIIECKEAESCMPFDGIEYYENHEYRWFKPLNVSGIKLINKLFDLLLDSSYIGKWFCLELCDDDVYTSRLDSCVDYAKRMLEFFGMAVTEICPKAEKLIELPCKIGDKVFEVDSESIIPYTVVGYRVGVCVNTDDFDDDDAFDDDDNDSTEANPLYIQLDTKCGLTMEAPVKNIGKNIFLTYENADRFLRGSQSK